MEGFGEIKPTKNGSIIEFKDDFKLSQADFFSSLSAVLGMKKQTGMEMELDLQTMYG